LAACSVEVSGCCLHESSSARAESVDVYSAAADRSAGGTALPASRRELWDMSKREEGTFSRSDFKFD
jgi:hypothetical protein